MASAFRTNRSKRTIQLVPIAINVCRNAMRQNGSVRASARTCLLVVVLQHLRHHQPLVMISYRIRASLASIAEGRVRNRAAADRRLAPMASRTEMRLVLIVVAANARHAMVPALIASNRHQSNALIVVVDALHFAHLPLVALSLIQRLVRVPMEFKTSASLASIAVVVARKLALMRTQL